MTSKGTQDVYMGCHGISPGHWDMASTGAKVDDSMIVVHMHRVDNGQKTGLSYLDIRRFLLDVSSDCV